MTMSQQKEEMSNEKQGTVHVNDLPRKLEELTEGEASNVRGGGSGGVSNRSVGEEIPQ